MSIVFSNFEVCPTATAEAIRPAIYRECQPSGSERCITSAPRSAEQAPPKSEGCMTPPPQPTRSRRSSFRKGSTGIIGQKLPDSKLEELFSTASKAKASRARLASLEPKDPASRQRIQPMDKLPQAPPKSEGCITPPLQPARSRRSLQDGINQHHRLKAPGLPARAAPFHHLQIQSLSS